ncbi:MAG: prephenate dehydrogenase, partial [Actinomycetota bacterium]|nr:prephenate dehydrogenase [Actinomycetota bacterium]
LETGAVVTDVGSVKGLPLAEVGDLVREDQLARYVGSHPMAGSERSGPLAGSAALFDGRPWAVTPHVHSAPEAVSLVEALARMCGAQIVRLSPSEHDQAVARTSHLPHLLAVLAAGQLADALPEHISLSGQGVRDVTRIAAGDPELWGQIIRANAEAVGQLLRDVRGELDGLIAAVGHADPDELDGILARGVDGTQAIPGKHGGPALSTGSVFVAVPDHPGELARLFADAGEIGVNIEDLRIDHDPGRAVGLLDLVVEASAAEGLRAALEARGWTTHR